MINSSDERFEAFPAPLRVLRELTEDLLFKGGIASRDPNTKCADKSVKQDFMIERLQRYSMKWRAQPLI
ncbi:hypothetical protein EAH84_03420 [Sphingomonas oligophenolica]|uniref:Uncharacterized protein n=1 Tax=Sphingomonas oligophenolica TaxID=301154 RepID=A0A502CRN1_9SPHN|nr:hypothetical protein EAH84_03420 [Sphingomonas oligophenolica]